MTTAITNEIKEDLKERGFVKTGDIGGQPKITYWTPDGRELRAQPSWHEYTKRNAEGQIIGTGTRDANLDNGWLLQKPSVLKLYCPHCDRWHNTEQEIMACGNKRAVLIGNAEKKAELEFPELKAKLEGNKRLDALEADITEIKAMLMNLIGGK